MSQGLQDRILTRIDVGFLSPWNYDHKWYCNTMCYSYSRIMSRTHYTFCLEQCHELICVTLHHNHTLYPLQWHMKLPRMSLTPTLWSTDVFIHIWIYISIYTDIYIRIYIYIHLSKFLSPPSLSLSLSLSPSLSLLLSLFFSLSLLLSLSLALPMELQHNMPLKLTLWPHMQFAKKMDLTLILWSQIH